MANTFELISTLNGNGSATSVTFSSIPQTFQDLVLFISAREAGTFNLGNINISFNGTNTGYSTLTYKWDGSVFSGDISLNDSVSRLYAGLATNQMGTTYLSNGEYYIPNYRGSIQKQMWGFSVLEDNNSTAGAGFIGSLWRNTAAITSITLTGANAQALQTVSRFSLYGIKNT